MALGWFAFPTKGGAMAGAQLRTVRMPHRLRLAFGSGAGNDRDGCRKPRSSICLERCARGLGACGLATRFPSCVAEWRPLIAPQGR